MDGFSTSNWLTTPGRILILALSLGVPANGLSAAGQERAGDAQGPLAPAASTAESELIEADRMIREVFASSDTSRYADAIRAYEAVLAANDRELRADAASIRESHVAALLAVMPSSEHPSSISSLDADRVMLWWRKQDPLPGTFRNERLEEHLARYVHAALEYEDGRDERGYDDRGEVLIRFGPPVERLSIRIPELVRAFDYQDIVSVPDLAENELWLYPHISDDAYFFFMRSSRRQGFRLALPSQVFPQRMRTGLDQRNLRGKRRAQVMLGILEEGYGQLALAHPFFGTTYDRIANYRALPTRERPDQFMQSTLAEAAARESESEGRRERTVPVATTNARGLAEDLPVQFRWARFLDENGTTRTEIYWSVEVDALHPSDRLVRRLEQDGFESSGAYLLTFAAARQSQDYEPRDVRRRHFRVVPSTTRYLDPQSIVLDGDTGRYHVGLQWTQYWTSESMQDSVDVGALLKIGTNRVDDLEALHGRGEMLEVSDLKPVYPSTNTPYPFDWIDAAAPPDLFFELYNLHYGPNDMTDYTIEYAVMREDGGADSEIRAASSSSGTERSTQERISVELGDAEMGERVHLSVRAIDNVTGESAERSISFRLAANR